MKQLARRGSLVVVLFLLASVGTTSAQEALRYVAPGREESRVLWPSRRAVAECRQAFLRGWDFRPWCGEGVVLEPATSVERLDSTECRDMVQVRLLEGALKGQVGCIAGAGLTSIKPQ
jgi:hypothetical protein